MDRFKFTLISGDAGFVAAVYPSEDGLKLNFEAGNNIKKGMNSKLRVWNKKTVGYMNRESLHNALDAWLNHCIKTSK